MSPEQIVPSGGDDSVPATASESPPPPLRTVSTSREAVQEVGRDGVTEAKRWLEATTRVHLPFNSYEMTSQCTLPLLGDGAKCFDLRGHFFETGNNAFVEVKKYSSAHDQGALFKTFLAEAYSATARHWQTVADPLYEFMWVTWHPFSQGDWSTLLSADFLRSAVIGHPELRDGQAVDETVIQTLASRTWILVLHDKQKVLRPADNEIAKILQHLGRFD